MGRRLSNRLEQWDGYVCTSVCAAQIVSKKESGLCRQSQIGGSQEVHQGQSLCIRGGRPRHKQFYGHSLQKYRVIMYNAFSCYTERQDKDGKNGKNGKHIGGQTSELGNHVQECETETQRQNVCVD